MTLYLKMGGRPAIEEAVQHLERRLQADASLSRHGPIKQNSLAQDDLAEFLIYLFGGAPYYSGLPVSVLFRPYCRCDATYDSFVDHLSAVLIAQRLPPLVETELRLAMETIRPRVLAQDDPDYRLAATAQDCA